MNIRTALIGVSFLGLACFILIIKFYPAIPQNIGGWLTFLIVGLPIMVLLEWFGGIVFNAKIFRKMSSKVRILFGILAALAVLPIYLLLVFIVKNLVAVSGG